MSKRAELQKKVKHHIRDLKKRGIEVESVTSGKSVEQLAWNIKTYNNFMEQKRIALSRERKKRKVRTNKQGYVFTKKDYDAVLKLQSEYNIKIQKEYKKYIKKYGEPSKVEKDYLFGKSVRHTSSAENIQAGESFRKVNLIDRVSEGMNIDEFLKFTKMKMNQFSFLDIADDRTNDLKRLYLNDWKKSGDLTDNQIEEILELYKDIGVVQRSQFNKDMKRTMSWIESETNKVTSIWTPYELIKHVIDKQYDRSFIAS